MTSWRPRAKTANDAGLSLRAGPSNRDSFGSQRWPVERSRPQPTGPDEYRDRGNQAEGELGEPERDIREIRRTDEAQRWTEAAPESRCPPPVSRHNGS